MCFFSHSGKTITIGSITVHVYPKIQSAVHHACELQARLEDALTGGTVTPALVDSTIVAWQRVLHHLQSDNYDDIRVLYAVVRAQLGMNFAHRLGLRPQDNDLQHTITNLREALLSEDVAIRTSADRSRWQNALCIALRYQFEACQDREAIDESISVARDALRAASPQSIQWGRIQNSLGNSLRYRFEAFGVQQDIDDAVAAFQAALATEPQDTVPWVLRTINFTSVLLRRFEAIRQERDLHTIITLLQTVQPSVPPDLRHRASFHLTLGAAYLYRFKVGRAMADLEQAIHIFRVAQTTIVDTLPSWNMILNNLAVALEERFQMIGDIADLDEAIALHVQTLKRIGRAHLLWAQWTNNLGGVFLRRFEIMHQKNDLNEAIANFEAAIAAVPQHTPMWGVMQNNRGFALAQRFSTHREVEARRLSKNVAPNEGFLNWEQPIDPSICQDIDRSIAAYRDALSTLPVRQGQWVDWHLNLGSALNERFMILGEAANLQEAISIYQEVLQVVADNSYEKATCLIGFAHARYNQYRCVVQTSPAAAQAADLKAIRDLLHVAWEFFVRHDESNYDSLQSALNLGSIYLELGEWEQASACLLHSVRITETLYNRQLLGAEREAWLSKGGNTYRRAAYALARAQRFTEAVVVLEQWRARSLGDALNLERRELERLQLVAPHLYQSFTKTMNVLASLETTDRHYRISNSGIDEQTLVDQQHLRGERKKRQIELEQTLAQIRSLPGYEAFLTPPQFNDITAVVHPGTPLVYLDLVAECSYALMLYRTDHTAPVIVEAVWLKDIAVKEVLDLIVKQELEQIPGSYLRGIVGAEPKQDADFLKTALETELPLLGERLIGPIAARLRAIRATGVVVIAGFVLPLLPLHAACYEVDGRTVYWQDEFQVTYAPSARVLATIQQRQPVPSQSILAIGNPTDEKPRKSALFTKSLAQDVTQLLGGPPPVLSSAATIAGVIAALQQPYHHLLFGCHGLFDLEQPLLSGLQLADGNLTLMRLLADVQLSGASLVTLCACQTAMRQFATLPDEAIGLPAGFLKAGARAVVAPLWPVAALPTVLLLGYFYRQMHAGLPPVQALQQAVIWLRTLPYSAFKAQVAGLRRTLDSSEARQLEQLMHRDYPQPGEPDRDSPPFAHPIYWAAFTYHGMSV